MHHEPVTSAELESLVDEDQVRLLYSKGVLYYFTNPINAALFAAVIWRRAPSVILITWVSVFTFLALGRTVLRWTFLSRFHELEDSTHWARSFAIFSALNGLNWGLGSILFFIPGFPSAQMLLLLIICGMSAGATALDSSYLPAYFAFILPEMLPLTGRLLWQADVLHGALAGLVVMFGVSMSLLARHSGRATRDAARLRFRNALLNETLESRVHERTEQLEQALMVRDEFLSIASHELKTPLTSLKLQLQLLERNVRKASARTRARLLDRCDVLRRQTSRLTVLVNTLLDVSRLDSEHIALEPHEIDLVVLVQRIVEEMRDEVRRAGSSLELDVPESLPGQWDPVRLEQIVINLLANAIKYGQGKPIRVSLERDASEARLRIQDRGIGIAPDDLGRIFGKFERAVPAKGYSGFGLGLFVVERLVHSMGGSVEVQSALGSGAQFTVHVPA